MRGYNMIWHDSVVWHKLKISFHEGLSSTFTLIGWARSSDQREWSCSLWSRGCGRSVWSFRALLCLDGPAARNGPDRPVLRAACGTRERAESVREKRLVPRCDGPFVIRVCRRNMESTVKSSRSAPERDRTGGPGRGTRVAPVSCGAWPCARIQLPGVMDTEGRVDESRLRTHIFKNGKRANTYSVCVCIHVHEYVFILGLQNISGSNAGFCNTDDKRLQYA